MLESASITTRAPAHAEVAASVVAIGGRPRAAGAEGRTVRVGVHGRHAAVAVSSLWVAAASTISLLAICARPR
jgi:hypothetical protein